MDPRFLRYYERELKNVRELGGEFAKSFPKIAGRLSLDAFECSDPYVERLLEGFAFLTARVQLKLDGEFPSFTQHLLELLYPGYLAPTPSMCVVQLRPSRREGNLAQGAQVARGTSILSRFGAGSTACEYRTAHDVTLLPLEIVSADYSSVLGNFVDVEKSQVPGTKSALRIVLRSSTPFNKLNLEDLTFFVHGGNDVAAHLHENVLSHNTGFIVQSAERPASFRHVTRTPSTARVGYEENEALLPCGNRAFQGQRLLHEYFAFPRRLMFFQVRGLGQWTRQVSQSELELILLFNRNDSRLEGTVRASNLALHCTPAVNLFPRVADRIHLTHRDHEYQVVPDRTRPLDLEVYDVKQVVGYGTRTDEQREFFPMYSAQAGTGSGDRRSYYTIRREPRTSSSRERARGPRSAYAGSELFMSLVDQNFGPFDPELKQLGVTTLCTNRDLPLHVVMGQGESDFTTDSGAPVESIRCLAGPSSPQNSPVHGPVAWRLLAHLNLDYLALMRESDEASGAALRSLLTLYSNFSDSTHGKQVEGVNRVRSQTVVRPLPFEGPITFGRGLEITLECDDSAFEGSSAFLLGSVLERFFARYASINGFCETVLRTIQRGEIVRWPSTAGQRRMV